MWVLYDYDLVDINSLKVKVKQIFYYNVGVFFNWLIYNYFRIEVVYREFIM